MPYAALKKFSEESPLIKSICNKNNETLTISEEKENEKEEPISVELKNLKMINRKKARLISAMEFPSHIIDQFKKDANFSQYINFWSGKKNPLAANIFHKFKFQYPKRTTYKSLSPVKNEGNFTFHFPETEIIKENNLDQSLKSLEISGDLDSMQEEIFDIIDEKYQKTKENSNSIIKRSSYDRNKTLFMDQLHEEMSPLKGNQIKSVKFKKNVSQDNRVKFNLPLEDEVQRANSFDNRK